MRIVKLTEDTKKDILTNLLTVSYTHLDVYKRQSFHRSWLYSGFPLQHISSYSEIP